MTWRRAGMLLSVMALVLAGGGCKSSTEPKDDDKFGIGNAGSFVTTGGAEVTFIVNLYTNRMSFNAKGSPASGVFNFQGKVGFDEFLFDDDMHGDVICYTIAASLTGNEARVGGVITRSDLFPPGTEAMWSVEDNGEGSNGVRDRITVVGTSDVAGAAQAYCTLGTLPLAFNPTMIPIETGNVQVHF
jgi:hypothetical protein